MRDIRSQLRLLRQNGGIYIAHPKSTSPKHLHHLTQHQKAGDALISRIRIWESVTDIPQPRRPQQSIHHRMGEHIGI